VLRHRRLAVAEIPRRIYVKKEQAKAYAAEDQALRIFSPSPAARVHMNDFRIDHHDAGAYIRYVMRQPWFVAAFPNQGEPITVKGGADSSHSERSLRMIKIGINDRERIARCEWACLHELAHIATPNRSTDEAGKTGHHDHPWRINYILMIRKMLGYRAARYLRKAFEAQGLSV
jgi:putative metallohydrolase (TIGR04338 family)